MVQVVQPCGEPLFALVAEHELQDAGELVQVLAGMVEVHDLGGLGKFLRGDGPDPGGAVAEDGELPDVVRAAADALGLHQAREDAGRLEGGQVGRRSGVADGVALVVGLVLGEEHGELDLAGAGAAVLALAVPAGGLLRGDRDAGAVDGGIHLVRQRRRRQRHQRAGGDECGPAPVGRGLGGAACFGGSFDALGGQLHPGQVGQQPGRLGERPGGRGAVVHGGQPWDIDCPATPSSASLGASPCLQAAQWYQARVRATGPSTVSMTLSR